MIAVCYKNRCCVELLTTHVRVTLDKLRVPHTFRFNNQKRRRSEWDAQTWATLCLPPVVKLEPVQRSILYEIHFSDGSIILLNLPVSTTADAFKQVVARLKHMDCQLSFLDGTQWKDSLEGHDAEDKPSVILVELLLFTAVVIFGKSCQVTLDQTVGDVCSLTNESILYQYAQPLSRDRVLSSLPHLIFEKLVHLRHSRQ